MINSDQPNIDGSSSNEKSHGVSFNTIEENIIPTKSKLFSGQILRDFLGGIAANIVGTFVAHPL